MSFFKNPFGKPPEKGPIPPTLGAALFDSFKDKIYPWIKVALGPDAPRKKVPPLPDGLSLDVIMKPWLGDLAIFYAVDLENMFGIMQEKDKPADMTKEELHNIAVANLQRDIQFKLMETNFGGYGFVAGGDHEAGALCMPGIWKWSAAEIGDNLVVAVPAKNLIMFVPASDPEKVGKLKTLVAEFHKTGERLLTKQLYRYDKATDSWSIYYDGK